MNVVVLAPPRELTAVRMFCAGTISGRVNATAVCPVARPTIALATDSQLSGRSGQSAMLS